MNYSAKYEIVTKNYGSFSSCGSLFFWLFCLAFCLFSVFSSTTIFAQNEPITVNVTNKPAKAILKTIEKQCNFSFIYSASTIRAGQNMTINVQGEKLINVLKIICSEINCDYSFAGRQIILAPKKTIDQIDNPTTQDNDKSLIVIRGLIIDDKNSPIIGAYIAIGNGLGSTFRNGYESTFGNIPRGEAQQSPEKQQPQQQQSPEKPQPQQQQSPNKSQPQQQQSPEKQQPQQQQSPNKSQPQPQPQQQLRPHTTSNDKSKIYTLSNDHGLFEIKVPSLSTQIYVSYVGFNSITIPIQKGKQDYTIILTPSAVDLREVVVVGYGTSSSRDLTGSIASINSKDITNRSVVDATSLLQNVAAGVLVSQSTGKPGENIRVRVRGSTSLTGSNEPLYVIDGMPMDDQSPLNGISPADIESIDILKDASAAAIYGSRAANGVIIVTTKSGKTDQKVTFSANYLSSVDSQIENFRLLEGDEYREFITDLAKKTLLVNPSNKTAKSVLDPSSGALGNASTNWMTQIKQPSVKNSIDISASGGSKISAYYISSSVFDQKGFVKRDELRRYNSRVNVDLNISPKFTLGTRCSATYSISSYSGTSMLDAQNFRPDLPIYDSNGKYFYLNNYNPVAKLNKVSTGSNYRFKGSIFAELMLLKDLMIRSSLSGNTDFTYSYQFTPSILTSNSEAFANEQNSNYSKTVFDNTISYKKNISINHYFDVLFGVSFENSFFRGSFLAKSKFALDDIYTNVSSGTNFSSSLSSAYSRGLFSSFARINYKYSDKYLFTLSARYDGSSMFGSNNRFGFFPSAAIAWRINKEPFMQNMSKINDLKIKISAGKTGVQNMSEYANRNLYSSGSYNDNSAIYHSQLANDDIKWEMSTQYDAGIDFALFNYKLTGSVGLYRKNTKDLIWSYAFPSSMAIGNIFTNIGSIRNQGAEMNVKGIIFDSHSIKMEIGLNISKNKNKVLSLVNQGSIANSSGTIIHGTGLQVLAVGYPMGAFLGYEYNSVIKSQQRIDELNIIAKSKGNSYYDGNSLYVGNLEYKDMNNDGIINTKDQTILGHPDPDFFGGLTASFTWKRFNVYANIGFQAGGKKLYLKAFQNIPAQLSGLVDYNLYNRWSAQNPNASVPISYLEEGVPRLNRLVLFDASFLKLQELRLTYNIKYLNKLFSDGQLFLSTTNLFTFTSYPGADPASVNTFSNYGGNYDSFYPSLRTFSLGIKLSL